MKSTAGEAKRDERLANERRRIGAFYTPASLSQILAEWGIRTVEDTILEPSFGGCGLLRSARKRLERLGCAEAQERVYGCDIDPIAFGYLAEIFDGPVDLKRFRMTDFLSVEPGGTWPGRFSTILVNPPYIPYQELGADRRGRLSSTSYAIPGVKGRASLWAYFVAHAVSFLAVGGRMAWILPGAFLQANYATTIRAFLPAAFERVAALVVHERLFVDAGTEEETVVLLADGFRLPPKRKGMELREVTALQDLRECLQGWDSARDAACSTGNRLAPLGLDDEAREGIAALAGLPHVRTLADVASIQIGLVTGANAFFVLDATSLAAAGLEEVDCRPVLAKFKVARGLRYSSDDHAASLAAGARGYLVDHDGPSSNGRVEAYPATFPEEQKCTTNTFRKRRSWSKPDDGRVPDAFFPVMHHLGPRLVLNPCAITCTNSVHRVYFKGDLSERRRILIAVSMLTSFSQISAETVGRRYGSGVLKHEPRDAEAVRLLLPDVPDPELDLAASRIERVLRDGDDAGAMRLADELIYDAAGVPDWVSTANGLASTLERLRSRRRPPRASARARPASPEPLVFRVPALGQS